MFGGVTKFDGTNFTVYNSANTGNGLKGDWITSLAIDNQGNKWFGTWQGWVSELSGVAWASYIPTNAFNGATAVPVNAIAVDAHGNKWFGLSQGGGVSEFKY